MRSSIQPASMINVRVQTTQYQQIDVHGVHMQTPAVLTKSASMR